MEQRAKILEVYNDNTAKILVVRKSACSGECGKCGGCGGVEKPITTIAKNNIGATVDNIVIVYQNSGSVLSKAFITYIVPLAVFILTYILCSLANLSDFICGVIGGGFFFISIFALIFYDKRVAKKNEMPTIIEIIG